MLRKTIALVAPLLFLAACGNNNPASPSGGGGGGAAPTYTVTLLPSNEVPPVSNADSTGTGTAVITLNLTRDSAGTITAATADFQVTMSGYPDNTSLTGAHIHTGAAGANGAVVVSLGVTAGSVTLAGGAGNFSRTGITVDPTLAQAIVANPAAYYFNVHTSLNPSGAARGQL